MLKEKLFHSIGEVAVELKLEQHVLRFWETQFKQINPIKHKGRRLYDKKCIENIKKIKEMLYEKGYTIKGVQKEFDHQITIDLTKQSLINILQEMIDLRDLLISKIED